MQLLVFLQRFRLDVFHIEASGGPNTERKKLALLFVKLAMALSLCELPLAELLELALSHPTNIVEKRLLIILRHLVKLTDRPLPEDTTQLRRLRTAIQALPTLS